MKITFIKPSLRARWIIFHRSWDVRVLFSRTIMIAPDGKHKEMWMQAIRRDAAKKGAKKM